MNSPFLLIEGGDLNFFRTLQELAQYVESPDIDAYLAVDIQGFKVELTAERHQVDPSRFGLVPVVPVQASLTAEAADPVVLRDRLVAFLRRLDVEFDERVSLKALLDMAVNKAGCVDD